MAKKNDRHTERSDRQPNKPEKAPLPVPEQGPANVSADTDEYGEGGSAEVGAVLTAVTGDAAGETLVNPPAVAGASGATEGPAPSAETNGSSNTGAGEGRSTFAPITTVAVPIGQAQGYSQSRIDLALSPVRANTLRDITAGLVKSDARLANGAMVRNGADAVAWILDQVAGQLAGQVAAASA